MDLGRFKEAQEQVDEGFAAALREIRTTGKRSHWIWYVFPQFEGLGSSSEARYYAIDGLAAARAYLNDPVLAARLVEISEAVAARLREGVSLRTLMNSTIDAQKLVSSMTLFGALAGRARGDERMERLSRVAGEILRAAKGERLGACRHTLARLAEGGPE